tara:strand:- start:129 stop:731 length:603 start_codon:yes stop_codon:yes gene_type:complete
MKKISKINLDASLLNTELRKEKAIICANRLLTIMQSNQFRDMILNMDRNYWLKGENGLDHYSNLEIYNLLMSGAEEWNGIVDYEIDLVVDDYKKWWSKVKGYMIPGKKTVYVNTKFFDTMSKMKVCSNFGHEWCHTMGARHPKGKFLRLSFAYFMNTVIEKLYNEFFQGWEERQVVTLKKYYKRRWYTLWLVKHEYVIRE